MNGNETAMYSEEGAFIDLKSEMEEFIKGLTEPSLQEFKNYISITFQSLKTCFDTVSMFQRQLNDYQEKLKRHIRNKNDIIKSIEDDSDRYINLKNETENLYLKIDNLKHEENEKDKEIKTLNEEIIRLNQRHDSENMSNFKPPEMDLKMKIISEKEDLEFKVGQLETKKHQQFIITTKIEDEIRKSTKIGEELEDEYKKLQVQIKEQENILYGEKLNKENSDKFFQNLRQENQTLKETIMKLSEEEKMALDEHDKLTKIHAEIEEEYNKKKAELNVLKMKTIPDTKEKLGDYEKKLDECKKVFINTIDIFIKLFSLLKLKIIKNSSLLKTKQSSKQSKKNQISI